MKMFLQNFVEIFLILTPITNFILTKFVYESLIRLFFFDQSEFRIVRVFRGFKKQYHISLQKMQYRSSIVKQSI